MANARGSLPVLLLGRYARAPQEYGGFSVLSEESRRRILDMTFGPEGLEPPRSVTTFFAVR